MSQDSTNDLAVSALTYLEKARGLTDSINDIGEVTGIAQEYDSMTKDLRTCLFSIRERAINLSRRSELFHKAKEKGGAA